MTTYSKFYYDKYNNHKIIKIDEVRNKNKILMVSCEKIHKRFNEYIIKTTHKEITDIRKNLLREIKDDDLNNWNKDNNIKNLYHKKSNIKQIEKRFNKIYDNIMKYTDYELNEIYEKQNNKWFDWCNDVIIYYVYNNVLNNQVIPVFNDTKNFYNQALLKLNESLK